MDKIRLFDDISLADLDSRSWRNFRQGVDILPLTGEPTTKGSSALLRYRPGARVPAHIHRGVEHILVLHGSQEDEKGLHEAGQLVINGEDTRHSIVSKEGCIVLAIWCGNLEPISEPE